MRNEVLNMKRFFALFINLALLFAVSCSAVEEPLYEAFDMDFNSLIENSEADLDGYEYSIRFYDQYVPADGSLFGYKQSSVYNDAVLQRIHDIETRYNCTLKTSNAPGADFESNFMPILISGQYFADTVMSSSYNLRPTILSGVFEPLSQVSDIIDYTDSSKWGNWRLLEQSVWDGNIYGVVPVRWPGMAETAGYMFLFNEKMAALLGQPDPREYIDDKSWSREKLGEMMLTYTTDDLGHPLKALLVYEGHFYEAALRANNANTYKLVNGQYVSGYHTPEGYDALKWADDFLHVIYADCTYLPCPGDSQRNAVLINEDVAMFFSPVSNAFGANSEIPFEVESYCVLPMPNGPERVKENAPYTTACDWIHGNMFFPINGSIDNAAFIADKLFESLDGLGEAEIKEYSLRYYYHDERDYDLAKEVFENGRYTYYSNGFRRLVVEALYGDHSNSVAEVLDSSEDAMNELVQMYITPTVESLDDIFG